MAPRASWKGYLKLSLVSCPIAMYPATTMAERVRFRTINRQTGNRIRQQLIDEVTGERVEAEDKIKGYEVGKSDYVLVEDEELDSVQIESTHTIEIQEFVARDSVDPLYLDEGYYLAPDDRVAVEPFSVIREAMRSTGTVGIAKVAMNRREKLLLLEPRDRGLLGKTIRYQYEVRPQDSYFADIPEVPIDPELLKLAEHIVNSKRGDFNPATFEDRYENAIIELIKAKRSGQPARTAAAPVATSNVVNLMEALRRSVEAEGKSAAPKEPAKSKRAKSAPLATAAAVKPAGRKPAASGAPAPAAEKVPARPARMKKAV